MELLIGVCLPAGIAIATGLYLEQPQPSSVVTTLLVLAGIGSVVAAGIA